MRTTGVVSALLLVILLEVALVMSPNPTIQRAGATEPGLDAVDRQSIQVAQQASVHAIDTTLADERFDSWLRRIVGPEAAISWESNDCGEQTGSPADSARDIPVCAQALVEWTDSSKAYVWLAVGTMKTGISKEPPVLFWADVESGDSAWECRTLGRLARLIARKGYAATAPAASR